MISTLLQTIKVLLNLCFLRSSPALLPYSLTLLIILVAIIFGLDILGLLQLKNTEWQKAFVAIPLYFTLFIGLVYFALSYRKMTNRLPKVLIAIFGTELILSIFLIILNGAFFGELSIIIPRLFFVWKLIINGKIFKEALDIKWPSAILIAFGIYLIASLPLLIVLGPQIQAAAGS